MNLQECYAAFNGDFEGTLGRLMKEDRIAKFLLRFTDDPSFETLLKAFDEKDWETAFRMAHTMKGSCGNLGLSELGEAASELTEDLRSREPSDAAPALLETVKEKYKVVLDAIEAYRADNA